VLHRATESFNADLQTAVSQLLTTALRTDPHNVPDHLLSGIAASLAGVVLRTQADAVDDPLAVGATLMACGALSQLASWAPTTLEVRGSILVAAAAAAAVAAHASPRTLAQLSELLVGVAPLVTTAAARLQIPRSHAAAEDAADMHSEMSLVEDDAERLLVACESLLTQVHTARPSWRRAMLADLQVEGLSVVICDFPPRWRYVLLRWTMSEAPQGGVQGTSTASSVRVRNSEHTHLTPDLNTISTDASGRACVSSVVHHQTRALVPTTPSPHLATSISRRRLPLPLPPASLFAGARAAADGGERDRPARGDGGGGARAAAATARRTGTARAPPSHAGVLRARGGRSPHRSHRAGCVERLNPDQLSVTLPVPKELRRVYG
jgi:hypothetical protein